MGCRTGYLQHPGWGFVTGYPVVRPVCTNIRGGLATIDFVGVINRTSCQEANPLTFPTSCLRTHLSYHYKMKTRRSPAAILRISAPKGVVFVGACCLLLAALAEQATADPLPAWREGDDGGAAHQREFLRPRSVVSTTGNVRNADALVADHQGYATLTMVQGGTAPMIILDYGRDVGGIPVFEVS